MTTKKIQLLIIIYIFYFYLKACILRWVVLNKNHVYLKYKYLKIEGYNTYLKIENYNPFRLTTMIKPTRTYQEENGPILLLEELKYLRNLE